MNKSKRIDVRLTPELKEILEKKAEGSGMTKSDYICALIGKGVLPVSHEEFIVHSMKENRFINGMLTDPNVSLELKQELTKEMQKYV